MLLSRDQASFLHNFPQTAHNLYVALRAYFKGILLVVYFLKTWIYVTKLKYNGCVTIQQLLVVLWHLASNITWKGCHERFFLLSYSLTLIFYCTEKNLLKILVQWNKSFVLKKIVNYESVCTFKMQFSLSHMLREL